MSDDERSESGSGSDGDDLATTGLVATRTKRSTAGNQYATLIANLDNEELQKELFAELGEEADDVGEYEGSDNEDDDAAFDSSSDDEDAGPQKDGEPEDLSGEKEVKRAERAEASKKRKAKDARLKLPGWQKKRVKLADDVKTEDGGSERPKKKSERANWMPTPADAPVRQSDRALARASREVTHANLKQSFARSEKQRQVMKSAAEREKKGKRMDFSQEERLQKAARVERETKKAFNAWEEKEKERQRLQDELLAAKRMKVMEGPFTRYWSGSAIWEDSTMKVKRVLSERKKMKDEERRQQEQHGEEEAAVKPALQSEPAVDSLQHKETPNSLNDGVSGAVAEKPPEPGEPTAHEPMQLDPPAEEPATLPDAIVPDAPSVEKDATDPSQVTSIPGTPAPQETDQPAEEGSSNGVPWLQGIEEYASMATEPRRLPAPPPPEYKPSSAAINVPVTYRTYDLPHCPVFPSYPQTSYNFFVPPPATPPPPPLPVQAQRCLIILEQFPNLENSVKVSKRAARASMLMEPKDITNILLPESHPSLTAEQAKYLTAKALKKRGGDVPQKQRCAITSWVAKYRDPMTGLTYADMHAYKMIHRILSGGCQWSTLLGAWVGPSYGPMGRPAHGVPEGFSEPIEVRPETSTEVKAEESSTPAAAAAAMEQPAP